MPLTGCRRAGIGPYEYWRAKQLADLGYVAFVADIYSQDVVQGPSMPAAQRSALTQVYNKNPTLWVSRLHAGLDEVRCADCNAMPRSLHVRATEHAMQMV